jgi:hypothetical protein
LTAFGLLGILGSAAAAFFIQAPSVPNLDVFKVIMTVFGLGGLCYGVFCEFVVAGLVQMRNWVRISMVILGGLKVAFWGLMSIAMLGLRNRMPAGSPATVPINSAFWDVGALIYASLAMIGLWWVVYFNLRSVRTAFKESRNENQAVRGMEVGRYTFWHVVVVVLAWFLLIGGLPMLAMAFVHAPFWFLGITFRGTAAVSVDLLFAGLSFYCGIGLLRRWRMAFRTAVVLQVISFLSACVALLPSATRNLLATGIELDQRFGFPTNSQFPESQTALIRIVYVFLLALISFWLYALFRCRNLFGGRALGSTLGTPERLT